MTGQGGLQGIPVMIAGMKCSPAPPGSPPYLLLPCHFDRWGQVAHYSPWPYFNPGGILMLSDAFVVFEQRMNNIQIGGCLGLD